MYKDNGRSEFSFDLYPYLRIWGTKIQTAKKGRLNLFAFLLHWDGEKMEMIRTLPPLPHRIPALALG